MTANFLSLHRVLTVAQHFFVIVWFVILLSLYSIYLHLPWDPSFWNTSENRSEPNPTQCSYSLWTPLSSHSRLIMTRVVATVPMGFVGENGILSYATGYPHHKCVYHHPDSSLPPPAQSCIQRGRSWEGLSVTVTPSLFGTESARQVSSLFVAWRLLHFVKDPTQDRQTSQSSHPLFPCLRAAAQLGKHSKAKPWARLRQPACTATPLPSRRQGRGRHTEA